MRTPVSEISSMGRNTQGVRLVNLKEGDRLVAVECVSESDLERYASAEEERSATPGNGRAVPPPEVAYEEDENEDDTADEVEDVDEDEGEIDEE